MAEKNIKSRIIHKHDIEANWILATGFSPKQGEIVVYDIDDIHDYERIKIGDGTTNVNNLPFYAGSWDDLKNRPFGETLTETIVIAETEIVGRGYIDKTEDTSLVEGEEYVVYYNGTKYTCTATTMLFGLSWSGPGIGNNYLLSDYGGEDSNYPFCIIYRSSDNLYACAGENVDTSVTMKVVKESFTSICLDEAYIPNSIARVSDISVISVNGKTGDVIIDIPEIDSSLANSGQAADAKATGDAISDLSALVGDTSVSEQINNAFKNNQADYNQNDSTAADYIKNRPFYTGDPVETVIVEESTVEFFDNGDIYMAEWSASFEAVEGQTYIVKFDGTSYNCVAQFFNGATVLGNMALAGAGDDTGEPFLLVHPDIWLIFTTDTSASHILSISHMVQEIKQIDECFIPDKYITEDKLTTVVSAIDFPVDSVNGQTGDVVIDIPEQAQADWNETDEAASSYIQNRPFGPVSFSQIGLLTFTATSENVLTYTLLNEELSIFDSMRTLSGQGEVIQVVIDGQQGLMSTTFDRGYFTFNGFLSGRVSYNAGQVWTATLTSDTISLVSGQEYVVEFRDLTAEGYTVMDQKYLPNSVYTTSNAPIYYGSGPNSTVQGNECVASGARSHAEGSHTSALGDESHAEGFKTYALGSSSHAEGYGTVAGKNSHSSGYAPELGGVFFISVYSGDDGPVYHVTDWGSLPIGYDLIDTYGYYAEENIRQVVSWDYDNNTIEFEDYLSYTNGEPDVFTSSRSVCLIRSHHAALNYSYNGGIDTLALSYNQHVYGKYNVPDLGAKYVHIVGNGTDVSTRSNAHTLDWEGNAWFAGGVYVGGTGQDDSIMLATVEDVDNCLSIVGNAFTELVGDTPVATQISTAVSTKADIANGQYAVTAASTDGVAYTATVPSITELTAGVSFIMIPGTISTSISPTLNVNGLGAKYIRRRLSTMATAVQTGSSASWLAANLPFRVVYDPTGTGCWIVEGQVKPAASDLYGTVASATKATQDGSGNVITDTYVTKADWQNALPKCTTISLPAANWTGDSNPWSQVVTINAVTENSKVDLQPTATQIVELQENGIALMTQNNSGTITVYALGSKPTADYTMQVLITETIAV